MDRIRPQFREVRRRIFVPCECSPLTSEMTSEEVADASELDEIDVVSTDTKSPTGLLQPHVTLQGENEVVKEVLSPSVVSEEKEIDVVECYCNKKKDGLALWCEKCKKNFHIECLKSGNPSPLDGDNFFRFTCAGCSDSKSEIVTRIKLTWQQVVVLALYNLGQRKSGRKGFFRWKEDVCEFISSFWSVLFGQNKNRSQTWHGTVAGVLSSGSKTIFRSGAPEFGEPGWWTLLQNKPPSYKPEQIGKEGKPTAAQRKAKLMTFEPTIKVEGLRSRKRGTTAVESAMELKEKRSRTQEAKEIRKAKQASVESRDSAVSAIQKDSFLDLEECSMDSFSSSEGAASTPVPDSPSVLSLLGGDNSCDSFSLLQESDLATDESLPSMLMAGDEEEEEMGPPSKGLSTVVRTPTPPRSGQDSESNNGKNGDREMADADEKETKKEGKAKKRQTAEKMLQKSEEKPKYASKYHSIFCRYLPMSLYEERQLLKLIESCPDAVENDPVARRFRRKLLIRQEKRERGLPVFDLDSCLQQMLQKRSNIRPFPYPQGGLTQSPMKHKMKTSKGVGSDYRILDRFQVSSQSLHSPKRQTGSFRARLIGAANETSFQKIVSPYTARILKPYIRRDYDTKPLKLKLLEEVISRRKEVEPDYKPPPSAPIDYCYVSPQHIPSINALCGEFFWPGIDLSECLQYPDFSVVVLYRRVVIGFGFMVPDVKYNEAYISFLFVHPEWRGAGIGTFMVYHLIQTCMGKDVTLHVSATNSAMLLYQKFGFKPEEFILDFYEKYYPEESTECRHAFVLRLRR
ncbi:Cysteine-rich protein 2-binding protein [Holothuria leucospilota]|uniref:Cysteine-rich protein 2-binding protein n=1 Tax=Holothuria leucospilota TaxID=206669 RepID=A0A9Q1H8K4_HOLLE|nr:Cysteine-rich protein 2-binding protein [Holothuria leucospilota]